MQLYKVEIPNHFEVHGRVNGEYIIQEFHFTDEAYLTEISPALDLFFAMATVSRAKEYDITSSYEEVIRGQVVSLSVNREELISKVDNALGQLIPRKLGTKFTYWFEKLIVYIDGVRYNYVVGGTVQNAVDNFRNSSLYERTGGNLFVKA